MLIGQSGEYFCTLPDADRSVVSTAVPYFDADWSVVSTAVPYLMLIGQSGDYFCTLPYRLVPLCVFLDHHMAQWVGYPPPSESVRREVRTPPFPVEPRKGVL